MSSPAPIEVHALLVCRRAEVGPNGNIGIEDVLEILPVDSLPGDAGPLTFLALVRNLPSGRGRGAFRIQADGASAREVARCPLEVEVPTAYQGRQVALQVRLPSLPVARGGWYEVVFEWEGQRLAHNRFAVGARAGAKPSSGSPSGAAPAAPPPTVPD